MKLIGFLKPDLKRLIFLLIILSPLIFSYLSIPEQFYLWYNYIALWGTILMIPFIFVSMIFFGGWDVGGGLFPYNGISDSVTNLIGIMFWYIISCVIVTAWDGLIESESPGKNIKKYEKAIVISLATVFVILVIIMPTIATSSIVMEKTTRQNISMEELVSTWNPEKQPVREDIRLQQIKVKNDFVFPASYQLPDVTACIYDIEGNLKSGYSVAYKTEDGRFIEDMSPSHKNIIIVQPDTETTVYLCKFMGLSITDMEDYENYDQVLLLTNVGMDNYSYCYNATKEDILRSEKINILNQF